MNRHHKQKTGLRRRRVLCAAGGLVLASIDPCARANVRWSPRRPVKIVVPFPPGGGSDVVARMLASGLPERVGQPVLVENVPGASGSIGSDKVYEAEPDGHTLLLSTMDTQAINPHVSRVRFNALRFVPVAGLAKTQFVLAGRPNLGPGSIEELRSELGRRSLSYCSAGRGTSLHVLMAHLMRSARAIDPLHVPYQGVAPALQDLLSGQVDLMLVPLVNALQYRNKLRLYAVTAAVRAQTLPDVPTLTESGLDLSVESWFGLLAPPGTPLDAVSALHASSREVMASGAVAPRLNDMGLSAIESSREEFAGFYAGEFRRWGEVVRETNLQAES